MSVNYLYALTYPLGSRDSRRKLLRGGFILFIPIIGQIIFAGYGVHIIEAVVKGNDKDLPEWQPGDDFRKGMAIFIPYLLYHIPLLLYLRQDEVNSNVQYAISSIIFSLFCIAVVRYAVTGKYSSFFQPFKNISILIRNFFKLILPFAFLIVGHYVSWALSFGTTLTLVFICFALVPVGYYFMIFGYTLGKLAPSLNINPLSDVIWNLKLEQLRRKASSRDVPPTNPQHKVDSKNQKKDRQRLTPEEMIAINHPMGNQQMFVDSLINPACYNLVFVQTDQDSTFSFKQDMF